MSEHEQKRFRARRYALCAALLVGAVSLAGCTPTASSDAGSSSVGDAAVSSDAGGSRSQDLGDASAAIEPGTPIVADGTSGADVAASAARREVITTGTVRITADDPAAAGDDAAAAVEAAGGRVDARTEIAPTEDSRGSASLQLRIPSARLTDVLETVKGLGTVSRVKLSSNDVTAESADLDARINALDASVTRLVKLLSTASNTRVLIELESAISARQGELDSLTAQRRLLSDQVAMSSIALTISSVADAPLAKPAGFGDAVAAGFTSFGSFFMTVLLVLGYALPWLVLIALGVAVALVVSRRRRAKKATV